MKNTKEFSDRSAEERRGLLAHLILNKTRKKDSLASIVPMSVSTLHSDALLDPAIRPEGTSLKAHPEPTSIFLTGATGFLGAFLLHELLQQTQADMYCLVRSPSDAEGRMRLQRNLEAYSLWNAGLSPRIIPVVGDLSRPNLGLSEGTFSRLASQVDVVYHSGAFVNLMLPYEALKAPNVLGTLEVLRLACRIKLKPMHFISTVAVFLNGGSSHRAVIREGDSIDDTGVPSSGYAQSKWVAEKLVSTAASRGIPVCIYRPGLLSGHSKTGAWNSDDLVFRIAATCLRIRKMPDFDAIINLAPVDYVSRAIVHLSRQGESAGKTFHLVNPFPTHYDRLVEWIGSSVYPLERMSYEKWRAEVFYLARLFSGNALDALLLLVSDEWLPEGSLRLPEFDCRNTLDGLAGTSIICPPLVSELLDTYFPYFLSRLRLQ